MKNEIIRKFLDMHYIEYFETAAGNIYAIEKYILCKNDQRTAGEEPINVTGWTKKQLYDWLGY